MNIASKNLVVTLALLVILLAPRALADNVTLVWDANQEADLAGYNVYFGTVGGTTTNKLAVGSLPTTTVTGLSGGATYFFFVTALNTDALESDPSNLITVSIPAPNQPPVAVDDSAERLQGQNLKLPIAKLLANDSDPDGDPIQLTSVQGLTANGATVAQDGDWVIYIAPKANDAPDTFTYTITDGKGGTATATVTITVIPQTIQAKPLTATVTANQTFLVRGNGIPGRTYLIQFSESLINPIWVTLGTRLADANGSYEYEDLDGLSSPSRFYRAVVP